MRKFPKCGREPLNDVMAAIFSMPASNVADVCGVGITTVLDWQSGSSEIPLACYRLLQLVALGTIPPGFGRWAGWRFVEDRIYCPGDNRGVRWEEIVFMDHYRQNEHLVKLQAETIEQLMKQRDFYSRQCSLESRLGLMLANLAGNS